MAFQGHDAGVTDFALSPGGLRLVSGSQDRTALIWLVAGRQVLDTLKHTYPVSCVDWSTQRKTELQPENLAPDLLSDLPTCGMP